MDKSSITDVFQGAEKGGHLFCTSPDSRQIRCLVKDVCDNVQISGNYLYFLTYRSDHGWDKSAYGDLNRVNPDGSGRQKLPTGILSVSDYFISGDYIYMGGDRTGGIGLFRTRLHKAQ